MTLVVGYGETGCTRKLYTKKLEMKIRIEKIMDEKVTLENNNFDLFKISSFIYCLLFIYWKPTKQGDKRHVLNNFV